MKKKNKKGGAKKAKAEASTDAAAAESTDAPATTDDAAPPSTTGEQVIIDADENEKAVDDTEDKADDASPPSLAQQSKLRSTSFRAGAGSGSPLSPTDGGSGDTAPEIYKKHVARIEELEKENKRLSKESTDAEKRWQKAEAELADLREAEGDGAKGGDEDTEKLVRTCTCTRTIADVSLLTHVAEERDCIPTEAEHAAAAAGVAWIGPPGLGLDGLAAGRPTGADRLQVVDD